MRGHKKSSIEWPYCSFSILWLGLLASHPSNLIFFIHRWIMHYLPRALMRGRQFDFLHLTWYAPYNWNARMHYFDICNWCILFVPACVLLKRQITKLIWDIMSSNMQSFHIQVRRLTTCTQTFTLPMIPKYKTLQKSPPLFMLNFFQNKCISCRKFSRFWINTTFVQLQ